MTCEDASSEAASCHSCCSKEPLGYIDKPPAADHDGASKGAPLTKWPSANDLDKKAVDATVSDLASPYLDEDVHDVV